MLNFLPSDDTVIDTTTVRRVADLSVQKNGPTTAIAGDRITYTIRIDNAGLLKDRRQTLEAAVDITHGDDAAGLGPRCRQRDRQRENKNEISATDIHAQLPSCKNNAKLVPSLTGPAGDDIPGTDRDRPPESQRRPHSTRIQNDEARDGRV